MPSDAKWQHRSGSTLAQVMAHFLMVPSHYLNHCSLIISEILWPSTEGNRVSQEILRLSILDMNLKIDNLRLQPHLPYPGGALPLWESVGMRRGFAPHFRHLDDLFAPQNLTMSTILFRSCWVPFRNPPFSACRRSFCPPNWPNL